MKEQQKLDEPLMSADEFYYDDKNALLGNTALMKKYANYFTQYHLQRQAEFIAERAEVEDINIGDFGDMSKYIVDKQSILYASKEYVELNIKR